MAVPLVSALEYLLGPRARHENDVSAARELNVRRQAIALPSGLSLRHLGTAGFELRYAGHTLLVDPYLTRPALRHVLSRQPLRSDVARVSRYVQRADAVLLGHTHFDHALDVPTIARLCGSQVYGSASAAKLMQLAGLAAQATLVEPGRVYPIGPFEVTFVESLHSKLALGLTVPMSGEITCDHLDGLHGRAYRCGQVYGIHIAVAGATFYHLGSANLIEDRIPFRAVDYFLMGISGRGYTRDYVARALTALSPRVLIPHHYDDFFRPLEAEAGFSLNVNFGGFVDEVAKVSRDFRIGTLDVLQSL